jgi:hypothetical protein
MTRQEIQAQIKSLKLAGKIEKEFDARQATDILLAKIEQVEASKKVLTESLTIETEAPTIKKEGEKQETEEMATFTYNDSNFSTISETEWLSIAQAVSEYVSGGNYSLVEYEPELRPYDAALIAVEEANYYVDNRFYKYSWKNWLEVLTTSKKALTMKKSNQKQETKQMTTKKSSTKSLTTETKAPTMKKQAQKQEKTMTNEAAAQHQRIAIAQVLSKSDKFSTGEELAQAVLLTYDAMIIDADKRTPVQKVIISSFIQEVARQKKAA